MSAEPQAPVWRLMPENAGYQHAETGEIVSFDEIHAHQQSRKRLEDVLGSTDEICDRVVEARKAASE